MTQSQVAPGYTQAQVDASLAANPNASTGGYQGVGSSYGTANAPLTDAQVNPYDAFFNNDPILKQLQASLNAGGIADAASRTAARQRALVQYGLVPSADLAAAQGLIGGDFTNDVTPDVANLANENTQAGTSTYANLQNTYKQNIRAIKQHLAARGLLDSGEAGYQLGNEQHTYDQGLYDNTQKLIDYLAQVQSQYNQGQQTRAADLAQGANDAYTRAQTAVANGQPVPLQTLPQPTDNGTTGGGGTPPPAADNSSASVPGASLSDTLGHAAVATAIQRALNGYQGAVGGPRQANNSYDF